jgi:tetratricopeptide (TPR) repeat protein
MVSGVKPFISIESVRDALDGLLYTSRASQTNALHMLTLVDEFLLNPALPDFENARHFAVNNLLVDLITNEFSHLRHSLNLSRPQPDTTLDEELQRLRQDGRTGSAHLIAWGYLYYRYVRVDLNISPENYASHVQLDTRTVRRHLAKAIEGLTAKLVIEEWKARSRLRKRRLYNALPLIPATRLFGRESALTQAQRARKNGFKQFYITGATGTGKTAFARELVRRWIEDSAEPVIENVVWITSPASGQYVIDSLCEKLCPDEASLSLEVCLSQYETLVIMDDIGRLSLGELNEVLATISPADVIFTHDVYHPALSSAVHLPMVELTPNQVTEYVSWLSQIKGEDYSDDASRIYQIVGGNPLAIQLMFDALHLDPTLTLATASIYELYQRQLEAMSPDLRRAWVLFSWIPEEGLKRNELTSLWNITIDEIASLLSRQIVTGNIDHQIALTDIARRVIEMAHQNNREIHAIIVYELAAFDRILTPTHEIRVKVMEQLLSQGFPPLPREMEERWLRIMFERQSAKRSVRWLTLLERRFSQGLLFHLDYLIDYGRSLRQFHRWEKAQFILEHAIVESGKRGEFIFQAKAMLELAVLFRITGSYEKAKRLLVEALPIAQRYHNFQVYKQIQVELTQIAIDRGDSVAASQFLIDLPEDGKILLLKAEALLLAGDVDMGITTVKTALRLLAADRFHTGIGYNLLGRLYTAKADYHAAKQSLLAAINVLETLHYPLALGRGWANLAVVYLHEKRFKLAKEFLDRAEKMQIETRDRIGLLYTQHNLKRLKDETLR